MSDFGAKEAIDSDYDAIYGGEVVVYKVVPIAKTYFPREPFPNSLLLPI